MKNRGNVWRKKNGRSQSIVIQKRDTYESYATGVTDHFRDSWTPKRSIREGAKQEPRVRELLDKEPGE